MSAPLLSVPRAAVPLADRSLPIIQAPKVLRHTALAARARRLNLAALLASLLRDAKEFSPEQWVLAAAEETSARGTPAVPGRWLEKLAAALKINASASRPPRECFETLPKAVWNEPSLLGELLCAARTAAQTRSSRSGRMSEGSVYTPAEIARNIVAEVHVGARRVVDPACGAGVFLLEAFQRAYRRRVENGDKPANAAAAALTHELAGVDTDPVALAVAEFSLRLAALHCAGLTKDVPLDLRLADALKPLPGLDGQCDCIVGNPPFIEGRGLAAAQLERLRKNFRCAAKGKVNLFAVFVERALTLLKDGGVMAFVLPATFQRNARYLALRELLLQHTLEAIKPIPAQCFETRVVETVVLRVRKQPPGRTSRVQLASGAALQARLPLGPVLRFSDNLPRALRRQIELMERHGVPLNDHFSVRDGISTGFQPFPLRLLGKKEGREFIAGDGTRRAFSPALHQRIIDGGEFRTFSPIDWAGRFIEYDKAHEHRPPHPGRPFNCQLRDKEIFDRAEKLLTRQTARGLIATVDRERYFVRNSVHVTYPKTLPSDSPLASGEADIPHPTLSLDALCACLNTRAYTDYLLAVTGENGDVFPQVHIADLKQLPLLPGLLKPGGPLAQLGTKLLALHKQTPAPAEEIAALKAEVEDLVLCAFGVRD